uniref:Uncharacterized protein n=1 Tax=Siphoviridae sp. ctKFk2 TaxID=2827841 RepID=A0A8S5T0E0_9CAUD|nr:MAG TPA: hypothetical protein [Siphoviridae sp. ctKFk2]
MYIVLKQSFQTFRTPPDFYPFLSGGVSYIDFYKHI